jgi:uncharacterized membrane protein YfcA
VPEYPGVYVDEVIPGKPIAGVTTSTSGFLGSIRRGGEALVKAAAMILLGVLIGATVAITLHKLLPRRCRQLQSN